MAGNASNIYEEEFQLIYHIPGLNYSEVEDMPSLERRAFMNLLISQREREKQAQEDAQNDRNGKQRDGGGDIRRLPMPGEAYGRSDEEKIAPTTARYVSRRANRDAAASGKDK